MNNICIFFFPNRIILICRNFGWKLKKYSIYLLESSREVCLINYIVIHVHQYRGNFFLHSNINKSIKRLTRLIRDDLTSIRCSFVLICNTRSFDSFPPRCVRTQFYNVLLPEGSSLSRAFITIGRNKPTA